MPNGSLLGGLSNQELIEGGLLIDGKLHGSSLEMMEHVNPPTGSALARFPVAGTAEIDAAVAFARTGLEDWKRFTPEARRDALWRLAVLLRENTDAFSWVTTLENGLPVMVADLMADYVATWFDYYAGWVDKLTGAVVPVAGSFDYTLREPIGVVAILLTWNGPRALIGMKVAAALAAGRSVVLRPPELSAFSGTRFGHLAVEAGIPRGVLNVVPCGPEVSEFLVLHPGHRLLEFIRIKNVNVAWSDSLVRTERLLARGRKESATDDENSDRSRAMPRARAVLYPRSPTLRTRRDRTRLGSRPRRPS